jgi:hypothetical protein
MISNVSLESTVQHQYDTFKAEIEHRILLHREHYQGLMGESEVMVVILQTGRGMYSLVESNEDYGVELRRERVQ